MRVLVEAVAVAAVVWGLFGFVLFSWDVRGWSTDDRLGLVLFSALGVFVITTWRVIGKATSRG